MQKFWFIILSGLLAAGCRLPDCTDRGVVYSCSPWGNAKEAKAYLDAYKHILVVCIYEDHWEDRGAHEYSLHHFKATVIRTYKGGWNVGERIAMVHGVDAPALTTSNGFTGNLMFVFTNGHTTNELGLATGDLLNYSYDLERVVQRVFPKRKITAFQPANKPVIFLPL